MTLNSNQFLRLTAQKIKQTRIEKGLQIKDLARLTGLSVYKIKKIETGNYNFYLKDFDKIQNILKIDIKLQKLH